MQPDGNVSTAAQQLMGCEEAPLMVRNKASCFGMVRHAGLLRQPMPMQAARSTAPREVADEVRLQEQRAAQKAVREDEALKTKIA